MSHVLPSCFADAVHTRKRVSGLTHSFYRYPARFSPLFVRAVIESFTRSGEMVFDPFMGGGTTLVEASALGRRAVGTDINSLSVFVSKVKTTVLNTRDLTEVRAWGNGVVQNMNLRQKTPRDSEWIQRGYQRNISGKNTWPIRKLLEMSLATLDLLSTEHQRRFARCVLLRTAQWALDCRKNIPPAALFRKQFGAYVEEMIVGAKAFSEAVGRGESNRAVCLHRSAAGIEKERIFEAVGSPRLILTSPPYPGVHVLYHRWQIQGRRETPAPYWIAGSLDGDGASFYTFGDRKERGLEGYFESAFAAFSSVARISNEKTAIVQMIAFSDPSWQLPAYLKTMERAGLVEARMSVMSNAHDSRLWRDVPNRKFYADRKGATMSSREVVLFHRLA